MIEILENQFQEIAMQDQETFFDDSTLIGEMQPEIIEIPKKTIVEDVKNPRYINQENSLIDCELKLDSFPQHLPFTASPTDSEEYARQVFQDCVNGLWGEVTPYSPPPPPSRDEIIKEKTSKIILTRDKHNTGGVFALDHWWPTNLVTIPQWNYLRDMAREIKFDGGDMDAVMTDMDGNPFNWQTLDNGDIGLTANMVVTITNMGARNVNQNSQNAKRHITNLNASEHPEDYDYSDGWTDIYEG
jgi:hypothetical protein